YGPKLPRSPFEIPWLNIFFYLNKKTRAKADTTWWKYRRLPGFNPRLIQGRNFSAFQRVKMDFATNGVRKQSPRNN
ncbi:MAG: hypothetical protein J7K53_02510, partial [Bacteroidales bacterium]|nr:hypothetical protein [Bacteroidales bacterium]